MKNTVSKLLWLCLLAVLTLSLFACKGNGGENENGGDADYTVSVQSTDGTAVSDVMVAVMKGEERVATKRLSDGGASFTLPKDDYTVVLTFTGAGASYWYDESACTLSAEKTSLSVTVYATPTRFEEIWAYDETVGDHVANNAYFVDEGSVRVLLTEGERTYFLFHPTRAGSYRVELAASGESSLGYFGGTFNVLRENMGEMDGGALLLDIQPDNIGATYVIGVDSDVANGTLTVTRTGDEKQLVTYKTVVVLDPAYTDSFAFCANWGYSDFIRFDVTDATLSAVLGADGYYHLNTADGPIIFLDLKNESPYLASLKAVCSTSPLGAMFYENGVAVRREIYNDLFAQYNFDVVPMTKMLADAMKAAGESMGWYDADNASYRFTDVALYKENAWLFAAGWFADAPAFNGKGGEDAPVELTANGVNARLEGGMTLYFTVKTESATVYIKGVGEDITVSAGGKTYEAVGGVVSFTMPLGTDTLTVALAEGAEPDFVTLYDGDPNEAVGGR